MNVYGSTNSLGLVAALFDACSEDGGIAILHRHSSAGADLVIFRGTDTPLNFPGYKRLQSYLSRTHKAEYARIGIRPEMPTDRSDNLWNQSDQITVRTQAHVVLVSGTSYGLRLFALACMALTQPGETDHYHVDHHWRRTSRTVELIVRNVGQEK